MAYHSDRLYAECRADFNKLVSNLLSGTERLVDSLNSLFLEGKNFQQQFRFDALFSIAFDIGADLFFESPLPQLVISGGSVSLFREAILSIPSFNDDLNPSLADQLSRYKMPSLNRRDAELRLFLGHPIFVINKRFHVEVLHPLLQFLCR